MADAGNGMLEATKHHSWKWLGALVMKPKQDAEGNVHLAVSSTKLQKVAALLMAVVLFAVMVVLWIVKTELAVDGAGVVDPIPDSMEHSLWVLLGWNGTNMAAGAYAYRNGNGAGGAEGGQ